MLHEQASLDEKRFAAKVIRGFVGEKTCFW